MRRSANRRLCAGALTAFLTLGFAAHAAEPVPGDACPTLNYILETGGPETSGVRSILRCNGTTWQQYMTIDATGKIGIGTAAPLDKLHLQVAQDQGILLFDTSNGSTYATLSRSDSEGSALNLFQNDTQRISIDSRTASASYFSGSLKVGSSNGTITTTFDNAGSTALSGDTAATIAANTNNWAPANLATASVIRITTSATSNLTGITGGADGRILTLINNGGSVLTLKNSATSTAANQFLMTADLPLATNESATILYDSTAQRWKLLAKGSATGVGDNLGNHIATANIQLGANWLSGDGGNEGLVIDASGRVGIGEPTPSDPLVVRDTNSGSEIAAFINAGNWGEIFIGNGTGAVLVGGGSGTGWLFTATSIPLVMGTNNTERMRIDTAGNVGIGVTSPPAKFVVAPPATETIAAAATITANACGTVKQITSTAARTTNTTNTFTAPTASYAGCCMDVINVGAFNITLDANTKFKVQGAPTDQVLGADDSVRVCSNGTNWYQMGAVSANQ